MLRVFLQRSCPTSSSRTFTQSTGKYHSLRISTNREKTVSCSISTTATMSSQPISTCTPSSSSPPPSSPPLPQKEELPQPSGSNSSLEKIPTTSLLRGLLLQTVTSTPALVGAGTKFLGSNIDTIQRNKSLKWIVDNTFYVCFSFLFWKVWIGDGDGDGTDDDFGNGRHIIALVLLRRKLVLQFLNCATRDTLE
jgi:hypothetical protein